MKFKNEKGSITLIVLISVVFLLTFLISTYIILANKAQTQLDITKKTVEIYDNGEKAEEIYYSYFGNKKYQYVMDGLICWLDGINNTRNGHSTTTTSWQNLIGNTNAYDFNIYGCEISSDCLNFDVGDYCLSRTPINPNYATIEIVLKPTFNTTDEVSIAYNAEGGGFGIIKLNGGNSYTGCFYVDGAYRTISSDVSQIVSDEKVVITATYGENGMMFYKNGSLINNREDLSGKIQQPNNSTCYALGANPDGTGIDYSNFSGEIYSVRIYDRQLSDDEVTKNYEVDQKRFFNKEIRDNNIVIPIYTKEQLLKVGSNESVMSNGKIYYFSEQAPYILMNDIDLGEQNTWVPIGRKSNINFEGNGKTITVTQNGIIKTYNEQNKYKYYSTSLATQSDYVSNNNLVCWLDGFQNVSNGHNNSSTTWVDLTSNNNNATITNLRGWGQNCLAFGGTSYAQINATSQIGTNRKSNFTVEIICSSMNYKGRGGIYCSGFGSSHAQFRLEQNGNLIGYNSGITSGDVMLGLEDGNIYSIVSGMGNTTTEGYYYINGRKQSDNYLSGIFPSETNVDSEMYLGKAFRTYQNINRYANVKIYAVRIYNRKLSEEEIAQNYEVDKQRFPAVAITEINNSTDLLTLSSSSVGSYKIMNNINLGINNTWVPIGRNRGNIDFEGNGKTITVTQNNVTKEYNEQNDYAYYASNLATQSDYITTGMSCWLDGIQNTTAGHNQSATSWQNLATNGASYNASLSNSPTWQANALSFDGINDFATIGAVLGTTKKANYTVEVVFDSDSYTSTNQGGVFVSGFGYTTAQLRVQLNGTVNAFGGSSTGSKYTYSTTNSHNCLTFAVGSSSCNFYINGNYVTNGSYAGISPSGFTNIYLGLARNLKGDVMRYGKCKIYAVRIYNRQLTEEEVYQNYTLDKQRFNLE